MTRDIVLHPLAGPPGSRLATLLGDGLEPVGPFRGVVGCHERIVAEVTLAADRENDVGAGLPEGPASPEVLAVLLRRRGLRVEWGAPRVVPDLRSLLELCQARGRSSIALVRAHPSLLAEMQVGSWFDAGWRMRALRRAVQPVRGRGIGALALRSRRSLAVAADLAFWAGVRQDATAHEWRRLTASSYVVLVYHRFAGELKPGQERIDISPRRFDRQLRALRLAGFRPLGPTEILAFHSGDTDEALSRRFSVSVDDAISDCLGPLRRHADLAPQLFVPTQELGGDAHWIDGEPVATWAEVRDLASAGVAIGSHARHHQRLGPLGGHAELEDELAGSLADLRSQLASPFEAIAYPNGDHDVDVCRSARTAGFQVGFTTQKGRNGAGTDPYCLRRVSVHGHDGWPAVLWKATTGEALPRFWLRLRRLFLGVAA